MLLRGAMEEIAETQPRLSPNFDHRTVVEFILTELPNASRQILGDAEAVFHEYHFNDGDKDATFRSMVESGGIDAKRFEAAFDLLVQSLAYSDSKELEGILGAEQRTGEVSRELGELALSFTPDASELTAEDSQVHVEPMPKVKAKQSASKKRQVPTLLPLVIMPTSHDDIGADAWQNRALCRSYDPEAFFPTGVGKLALEAEEAAKAICKVCNVVDECRTFALEAREPFGVWGGTSENERVQLIRRTDRQKNIQAQNKYS
jgi:WhiB family redox-sensing transcriptional regulator